MSARLVEVFVPDEEVALARTLIARHARRFWQGSVPGAGEKFSCIVQKRYVERLLADLNASFGTMDGFTTLVLKLEALLPPLHESAETALPHCADLPPQTRLEHFFSRDRISTDELYDDIAASVTVRPAYLLTVAFSAIIAALGMRSGQTAVVIGAMVIAPLLGPTMGMALAATVGNQQLGRRATLTLGVGVAVVLALTIMLGWLLPIDINAPELRNRAIVQPADIALALASGAAGVLAFSQGASLALVGVMIAVALVPPLAAAGMFLGSGHGELGISALMLFATNLICINVAGIAMFLLQGLPPRSLRLTWGILAVWMTLLLVFIALVGGWAFFGVNPLQHLFDST